MTQKELIEKVAEETGVSKGHIKDVLSSAMKTIMAGAAADGKCIVGRYHFKKRDYPARTCRNPQTGETIQVPAKQKIVFSHAV